MDDMDGLTIFTPNDQEKIWVEKAKEINAIMFAGIDDIDWEVKAMAAARENIKHIPISLVGPSHTSYIDEMALIHADVPVLRIPKEPGIAVKKIGYVGHVASLILAQMSSVSAQDVENFTITQRGNISPTQIELSPIPNLEYETPSMPEYRAPGSFKKLNQRQKRKRSKW